MKNFSLRFFPDLDTALSRKTACCRRVRSLAGLGLFLASLCVGSLSAQEIPTLQKRVTDQTATLSAAQMEQLEAKLKALEDSKGIQVAVLVVASTQPETIEQYSIRVADSWKLGRKGVDDGVLFLIALQDRAMRIEVGYGLEGVLTDALTKRIIAEIITPYFRADDYNGGINAGVDALISVIQGEELPAPEASSTSSGMSETLFNVLVAIGVVVGMVLRGMLGRFLGASVMGLAVFLIALIFLAFGQAALIGFIVFVLVLLIGAGGSGGSSGWSGGGGWSSGGGFSGGGGSFGGGGSSGRW